MVTRPSTPDYGVEKVSSPTGVLAGKAASVDAPVFWPAVSSAEISMILDPGGLVLFGVLLHGFLS